MFQITILLLYLASAAAFALSRLPRTAGRHGLLTTAAFVFAAAGLVLHGRDLYSGILADDGLRLSLVATVSLIGWQLAAIGFLGAIDATLRGMAASLLALAAIANVLMDTQTGGGSAASYTWQVQTHVLLSMFAYGLLTAGAIVAIYALAQDQRLRAGKLSAINHLFAPLETTERLLFGITTAGFAGLLLAVVSGFTFVENLFAQHLLHKTTLSLLALLVFGVLLVGRWLAGWRGRRAVYLYLWGFAILGLAYFGSRFVLEVLLERSWG